MRTNIYSITCIINGKIYVGQTEGAIEDRWARHVYSAKRNAHKPLYADILKYGREAFVLEKIQRCKSNYFVRGNTDKERFWMIKLNTLHPFGYNIQKIAGL